jgi:hypothetical protein
LDLKEPPKEPPKELPMARITWVGAHTHHLETVLLWCGSIFTNKTDVDPVLTKCVGINVGKYSSTIEHVENFRKNAGILWDVTGIQ